MERVLQSLNGIAWAFGLKIQKMITGTNVHIPVTPVKQVVIQEIKQEISTWIQLADKERVPTILEEIYVRNYRLQLPAVLSLALFTILLFLLIGPRGDIDESVAVEMAESDQDRKEVKTSNRSFLFVGISSIIVTSISSLLIGYHFAKSFTICDSPLLVLASCISAVSLVIVSVFVISGYASNKNIDDSENLGIENKDSETEPCPSGILNVDRDASLPIFTLDVVVAKNLSATTTAIKPFTSIELTSKHGVVVAEKLSTMTTAIKRFTSIELTSEHGVVVANKLSAMTTTIEPTITTNGFIGVTSSTTASITSTPSPSPSPDSESMPIAAVEIDYEIEQMAHFLSSANFMELNLDFDFIEHILLSIHLPKIILLSGVIYLIKMQEALNMTIQMDLDTINSYFVVALLVANKYVHNGNFPIPNEVFSTATGIPVVLLDAIEEVISENKRKFMNMGHGKFDNYHHWDLVWKHFVLCRQSEQSEDADHQYETEEPPYPTYYSEESSPGEDSEHDDHQYETEEPPYPTYYSEESSPGEDSEHDDHQYETEEPPYPTYYSEESSPGEDSEDNDFSEGEPLDPMETDPVKPDYDYYVRHHQSEYYSEDMEIDPVEPDYGYYVRHCQSEYYSEDAKGNIFDTMDIDDDNGFGLDPMDCDDAFKFEGFDPMDTSSV